jgi:exonuclease III
VVLIVVCLLTQGDINIAHREIDHCDPEAHRQDGGSFEDHPCRRWMNSFVRTPEEAPASEPSNTESRSHEECASGAQMVDTFRHFHPNQTKAFTVRNANAFMF